MIEPIIIGLLVFAACAACLYCGYKFGCTVMRETILKIEKETGQRIDELPIQQDKNGNLMVTISREEPSGIITRPTAEELDKMNEDKNLKESKEEVARVIREAEEPRI